MFEGLVASGACPELLILPLESLSDPAAIQNLGSPTDVAAREPVAGKNSAFRVILYP
jgi:hypothetical protein|eukprot:COSAG06_NODE_1721_length_8590_cov_8.511954_10_plen_57_part_00